MSGPIKKDIGKLRDRVAWYQPIRSRSATGQSVREWELVGSCWSNVEIVSGRDTFRHDQQQPEHTHRITIRGGTIEVKHDWKAVWNGANLEVVYATPASTGIENEVVILCKEIAASTS
jgi:SPP1 family predicted phage head-tail adaptor